MTTRNPALPVILLLTLPLASCRSAQPARDPLADFAARTDATRAALRIPGLSVAVVLHGELVMARGFGAADVTAGTPAGADTLYPIGSITKTFTSTLMLQLGWFTQLIGDERVVWHTSWWPDAYSGLLVKVPSRKLTLVLLANSDALVAPQGGASNVLVYPIANDFLRAHHNDRAGKARMLAARALATGVDTDGLRARIEELLRRLP